MAKHPGVWFFERQRKNTAGEIVNVILGRWRDPNSGDRQEYNLTGNGYTTAEARTAWAKDKAKELVKLRQRGPVQNKTISEAIADYFKIDAATGKAQVDLRQNTVNAYTYALDHLKAWAAREGITHCAQLTPGKLAQLHGHIKTLRKRDVQAGKGTGRGARKASERILSPASRNQILRGIHTFLNTIRRLDLTPEIDSDAIKDRLPYVRKEKAPVTFLRPNQIAALLAAAERHDSETHRLTREEHDGLREKGTTRRYEPIRPFILACLLMGGRFGEVAGLRWDEIDLDAGEIRLDPKRVKTKHGRVIRLKVAPMLWTMLREMKLKARDAEFVFGENGMRRDLAESARHRLMRKPRANKVKSQRPITDFGAPAFSWHMLRRCCGTYLANMPGANLKHVADYLGHSISMAESLYWGAIEIDPRATTLEQAMGIAPLPAPAVDTSRAAPVFQLAKGTA